ncbi:FecCD family ABC transporter permease [Halotalea alkalilenta]|uniref:FecCD family ABC transporter permease n=1 Tax=Halotalea alkalilenta TaxID=376489 RepID=UPI0005B885F6|nr:iron ABC transporter permease [Halotalea alkalilenta]
MMQRLGARAGANRRQGPGPGPGGTSRSDLSPRDAWLLRWRGHSLLLPRRSLLGLAWLLLGLMMVFIASLSIGSMPLAPQRVIAALFGSGDPLDIYLVRELRLGRLGAALASGAGFALSGCLLQTLTRNRLAMPDIIGINNGATAFAVASIVALPMSFAPPMLALVGAVTATALTFALAGGVGVRGYRFIIVGVGIGAVFGALTNLMLARTSIDAANAAFPWTVGSLNGSGAGAQTMLWIGLAVCLPLAMASTRGLSSLRFAEPVALGWGVRVARLRLFALALAVICAALAVAVAGPVGMIALIGPELARRLSSHRSVPVLNAALAGAILMALADLLGRTLLAPVEVPVGIVTALVGGPYLIWILLRGDSPRAL